MDDPRSRNLRAVALKAIGGCFGLAAIYHLAVVLVPALGDHGSPIRHSLFVGIDLAVALGFYRRPRFFFWVFCLLGLQQLHSHGRALILTFAREQRVDWQSLLVLTITPIAGWLLWQEYRQPGTNRRKPLSAPSIHPP
jgi:hypothetical protein